MIVAVGIGVSGLIFRAIGIAMKMARHAVIISVNMISIIVIFLDFGVIVVSLAL